MAKKITTRKGRKPSKTHFGSGHVLAMGLFTLVLVVALGFIPSVIASAAETGFLSPTTNTQNASSDAWNNPTNAYANGGGHASNVADGDRHRYAGFGISVPTGSTINGIEVVVDSWSEDTDCRLDIDLSWNNGSSWTSQKSADIGVSESTITLGSTSDDWRSGSWSSSEFASFVVRVEAEDPGSGCDDNDDVYLDWIRVKIHYTPVNAAPTAQTDSVSVNEDGSVSDSVSATDTDGPQPLVYSIVANPIHGSLTSFNSATGAYTYEPAANYFGSDSFTFKAYDGALFSNTATISITVDADNDAPVANNNCYATDEDTMLMVVLGDGVVANDTDVENDFLMASVVTSTTNGMLLFSPDGSFIYTPDNDYTGPDSFTYLVNDGDDDSNTATVCITVGSSNDLPAADADAYATDEDVALVVSAPGVLTNDIDGDSDPLTAVLVANATNGSVSLNADGSFTYTPAANYFGPDSFTYKANDGTSDSSVAVVSITVNAVNDTPGVVLVGSNPINLTAGGTFSDPGATGSDTEDGSLTPVVTGSVDTNTPGTYTLTYTVTDSGSDSAQVTRDVIVSAAPAPAPPAPSNTSGGGGGGGGGGGVVVSGPLSIGFVNSDNSNATGSGTSGLVLGTTTDDLPAGCNIYLGGDYLRMGNNNNAEDVKKLQIFLNKDLGINLPITGVFGPMTFKAVNDFQVKHWEPVLKPWVAYGLKDEKTPTGYVYKTTKRWINLLECQSLDIPVPQLP